MFAKISTLEVLAFLLGVLASLECFENKAHAEEDHRPGTIAPQNELQAKAIQLMPIIPEMYIKTLTSRGSHPRTPTEHYIFSCLAPSIQYETKKGAMTDEEFARKQADLTLGYVGMWAEEEACLDKGLKSGRIKIEPKKRLKFEKAEQQ